MNISRKYLTIYAVIGSLLIFSFKDMLSVVHTVLHTVPNPFHSHTFALRHSFLPSAPLEDDHRHAHEAHASHTHEIQPPATGNYHDVMDHIYHNKKDKEDQPDKAEIKSITEFTWDVQAWFSFHLIKPYQLYVANTFFALARTPLLPYYPPTPPPEFVSYSSLSIR